MIKITNIEADYLRTNGMGNFIKKSYSKHPSYYLVESNRVLIVLNKFRESRIVK